MFKITTVAPSLPTAGTATANVEASLPGHGAQALAQRPASLPARAAALEDLPPDILRDIGTHFAVGGRDLTALSRTSKALHATFIGRAKADREMHALITALDTRIDALGTAANLAQAVSTVMADVSQAHIETRSYTTQADRPADAALTTIALPDEQKVRLLSRLRDVIWQHLPGQFDCVATLAPIVAGLCTQARALTRHAHRHAVLVQASTLLPGCVPRQPQLQQHAPAAGHLFTQFKNDCNAILSDPPAGAVPVTSAECATTLCLLADHIRLMPEPQTHAAQWQAILNDRRAGSGDERVRLLRGLIAAAGALTPPAACQDALGKILAEIPAHAAPTRTQLLLCMLANPAHYVGRFPAHGFDALAGVAQGLPDADRGRCTVALANGLVLQQPARHEETFDALVATVHVLDGAPAEALLCALANAVEHLPVGVDRGAAIESLVRSIGLLDPGAMHGPLESVIASLYHVPQPHSRSHAMAAVLALLATLPTEGRSALLRSAGRLLMDPSLAPPVPERNGNPWLPRFTQLLQLVTQHSRREAFATLAEFHAIAQSIEPSWRAVLAPEIAAARERTKHAASVGGAALRARAAQAAPSPMASMHVRGLRNSAWRRDP